MKYLQCRQPAPTLELNVKIVINADMVLRLIIGVIWLMKLGTQTVGENLSGSTESVLDWCESCYVMTERLYRAWASTLYCWV